jgi:hypothetical protein
MPSGCGFLSFLVYFYFLSSLVEVYVGSDSFVSAIVKHFNTRQRGPAGMSLLGGGRIIVDQLGGKLFSTFSNDYCHRFFLLSFLPGLRSCQFRVLVHVPGPRLVLFLFLFNFSTYSPFTGTLSSVCDVIEHIVRRRGSLSRPCFAESFLFRPVSCSAREG